MVGGQHVTTARRSNINRLAHLGRHILRRAVTGTGVATSTIRDGDDIQVDGATGTVTILRGAQ